jgi:phage repressor protein C with HTH and peptisase S24 domain
MVKRLQADPMGKLKIIGENPRYESWDFDPSDNQSVFVIVGRVVKIIV